MCMPGAHGGLKSVSDALKPESGMVVNHHVVPLQEQQVLLTAEPHFQPLSQIQGSDNLTHVGEILSGS